MRPRRVPRRDERWVRKLELGNSLFGADLVLCKGNHVSLFLPILEAQNSLFLLPVQVRSTSRLDETRIKCMHQRFSSLNIVTSNRNAIFIFIIYSYTQRIFTFFSYLQFCIHYVYHNYKIILRVYNIYFIYYIDFIIIFNIKFISHSFIIMIQLRDFYVIFLLLVEKSKNKKRKNIF